MAYDQISIRDIAAKAEIAYTTFFRHYQSKEALLTDLADDEAVRLLDASGRARYTGKHCRDSVQIARLDTRQIMRRPPEPTAACGAGSRCSGSPDTHQVCAYGR